VIGFLETNMIRESDRASDFVREGRRFNTFCVRWRVKINFGALAAFIKATTVKDSHWLYNQGKRCDRRRRNKERGREGGMGR
jgi:hypothetical protein